MVNKKSGSHRQGLKDKYKIIKKVKEHRKKLNKLAKKNPNSRNKIKRDPGIPNLWPFKEKLIREAEHHQEQEEEMRIKLREARQSAINRARRKSNAAQNQEAGEEETVYASKAEKDFVERRWYFKELKKVLDKADVVLEVVDARDPMGCRCYDIERRIQAMNANGESKKLVIVMNKIDLIPPDVATQWVTHFRREFPTIAFKSSTQQQSSKLSQNNVKLANMEDSGVLQQKGAVGSGALMSLLKNYARTLNLKKAITVGIIGFPNVGKSSIINSLKRSKAAGVSASAGHTKVLQTIKIDHNISLIDSPGVLFGAGESQADLVLRNCVKVEQMEDPLDAVVKLLAKVPKESLLDIYRVADFSSPQQFVSHVAHKRGKLKAGGVPNLHAAAVTILKDWTSGAIPFYTLPPAVTVDPRYESKDIVSGFGKELDIEQLLDEHTEELRTLDAPVDVNRNYIVTEASAPLKSGMDDPGMEESENEDNDDDEEDDEEEEDDEGAEEDMGEEAGERMNDEEAEDEVEEEEEEAAVEAAPVTSIDMSKVKKSTKGKGEKKGSVKKAVTRSAAAVAPGLQRNKEIKKSQKKATKKKNKKMAD